MSGIDSKVEQAIAMLGDAHHSVISEKAAHSIADDLGVPRAKIHCYSLRSDRGGDPKGLRMNKGREGAKGIGGRELAESLCDALGLLYERKIGRGFQVQECCSALNAHFIQAAAAVKGD